MAVGGRASILGGGSDTKGLEGGEYDPERDEWTQLPRPPVTMRGRYLIELAGLVGSEYCIEGREESINYQFFHVDSRRWSQTRQRTFQCGNVIVHDEDAILIAETARTRNGWIPLHLYGPTRDAWRHGQIPAAGGPPTLGGFGDQTPAMFPDHLHWDGRRLVVWGGASIAKDQPDPCGAKPGPNPACAPCAEPPRVASRGGAETRTLRPDQIIARGQELKEMLGHYSVVVTERYAHLRPDLFAAGAHQALSVDLWSTGSDVVEMEYGQSTASRPARRLTSSRRQV